MAKRLLGFEGNIFYDPAPNQDAATLIEVARDVSYGIDPTLADTSERGVSTRVPYAYARAAQLAHTIELEINNEEGNAFVTLIRTVADTGAPISIKTRDKAAGYGVLGDYVVTLAEGQGLTDAQRLNITLTPNNDLRGLTWGTG